MRSAVLFFVSLIWLALGACLFSPSASAASTITVHVKVSTLAMTCGGSAASGAEFVINQIDDPPASITVTTSDGLTSIVPLTFTSGPVGHYIMSLAPGTTVTDAIAVVPAAWTGEFNLSHYICGAATATETTSTPPLTSTPPSTSEVVGPPTSTESSTLAATSSATTSSASSSSAVVTVPSSSTTTSAGTAVNAPLPPSSTAPEAANVSAANVVNAPLPSGALGANATAPTTAVLGEQTGALGATGTQAVMWRALLAVSLMFLGGLIAAQARLRRRQT